MTRTWYPDGEETWGMYCDYCATVIGPREHQRDLPLSEFAAAGWFIAKVHGDRCPVCVKAAGGMSAITTIPWQGGAS